MAFDPASAKPVGFDPASATPVEFDPSSAEEVTASWADTLKAIPSQIVGGTEQAAGGMVRALGEADVDFNPNIAAAAPGFELARNLPGLAKKAFPETFEDIAEAGTTLHDIGQARIESDTPENQTFWQKAVSTAAQSAGQAVPLTLAAAVTKNPGLVAAGFGTQEFGRAYGEGRAKGLEEDQAFRYASINGLVEAGTEFIPAKQLFKQDQGLLKRFVNFMAAELPGENVAEISQAVNEWANGLREDLTVKDIIDTMALTSAATLIGGGGQATAAHYLEKLTKQAPPAPEATPEEIIDAEPEALESIVEQEIAEPELPVPDLDAFQDEISKPETGESAPDRRTADRPTPDRRAQKRELLKKMSPEDREIMLTSDAIPSLPGKNAFEMHMEENPGQRVLFLDYDDFKTVNDKRGEKLTDKTILEPSGEIMQEIHAKFPDVSIFHRSGDEFFATGASDERLKEFAEALRERLKTAKFEAILPDGSLDEHTGIGFSYGFGQDEETSRAAAKQSKAERKASGERSGVRDAKVLAGQAPAGNQVPAGQVAFDPTTAEPTNERIQEEAPPAEAQVLTDTSEQNLQQSGDNVSRETSDFDPNTVSANPIGAIYKGYQRLATKALSRVNAAFGWKFTPLGKLPAQKLYLKDRYETLGKIADVENISRRIYETFRKLDASEAEKVYQYFTTKDADLSKLPDKAVTYEWKGGKIESTVKRQAETIKKLIDRVGQQLVGKGLLSKESFEKYQDQYLPRIYLKHLLGPEAVRGFAGGKKPGDMGYLKERKDIPQDIRELVLGEITDPGYLASKSLGRSMRDLAILDWFEQIAQRPDWALPEFLVDYKGQKVSIWWLKAESDRIKEQVPYYTLANQQKAKAITDQLDALVARGESKMNKVTADYRQVPDTAQYGRLRGMYIRKEIYNDLVGIPGNKDPNAEWYQQPFEYGGIGTKITQLWKMSKVALNPPTQIRNFISNGILLQLSGVGTHRVLPLMIQAIQEIRQNGKYWRIAKKYGVTGSTFANNELYRIERALLDLKARDAGKLSMATLRNAAGVVADAAGDMYQFSEAIWKTAKIIDSMKRENMSESDAVLEAQKWMYDYSLVPQSVRYFRNTPLGIPFLTFYYKTLPRMLEVLATAPHRFAPYVAIPAMFTAFIASDYDVEPEDVEKLKLALPEYIRDKGHVFFLPYKDQHGRWQAFDFSYLLPWSMFEQLKNNIAKGDVKGAIDTAGIFGGPVVDLLSAIGTGVDPFTKKEIADKSDPPAHQVASWMNYLWSMAAPTWLTDNGVVGKMREALTQVDKRSGEPKLTVGQAALRGVGLNVYPVDPEADRQKNIRFMAFELQEIQRRLGERLRDKNLTDEDKRDIRKVYKELMDQKKFEIKDYREKSKVNPKLLRDAPKEQPEQNQDGEFLG